MKERRSFNPTPISRNSYQSSHHFEYTPHRHHHNVEKKSHEDDRSLRVEPVYHFDREFNFRDGRFSDTEDRDRGRYRIGLRRSMEKREHFDKGTRFSDYEDRDRDQDEYQIGVESSRRLYGEGSKSTKFELDRHLGEPRKFDGFSTEDYSYKRDYYRVVDGNLSRADRRRDYYQESLYADARMHSDSYSLLTKSHFDAGEGSSHKDGYFRFPNELELGEKEVNLRGREEPYFEKKEGDFYFPDEHRLDKPGEMYKHKKEDSFLSSGGYLSSPFKDNSSNFIEDFPRYSTGGNIHSPSRGIRTGSGLSFHPLSFNGYNEKRQNMSPVSMGGPFNDFKSHSRSFLELAEEKRGDYLLPESGRSELKRSSSRHMSKTDIFDSIDEINKSSRLKRIGDHRLWDKYPSSPRHIKPNEFDARGSHEREVRHGYSSFRPGVNNFEKLYGGPQFLGERSDDLHSRDYCRSPVKRDDVDHASLLKRSKFSRSRFEKTRRGSREIDKYKRSFSKFVPSGSNDTRRSGFRDIKERSGPVRQKLNVSQRIVERDKPSVKKRLAPAPSKRLNIRV